MQINTTGLFRRGEYVRFHALAQLPAAEDDKTNSKRFKGALKFEHRITNTRNISETEVQARELSKKALKRKGIPYLIALLIMTTLFALTIYRGFPKVMVYEYAISESRLEKVKVAITPSDTVRVTSIDSEYKVEEPFPEFIKKLKGSPSLSESKENFLFLLMATINLLILGSILAAQLFEFLRNRSLLRILGSN